MAAATIALVALSAIAAAGVYAATLSLGSQAAAATTGALSATSAPRTTTPATASAQLAAPTDPQASPAPQHRQPVTAVTTSPRPAAGSRPAAGWQPWPQAGGSQASSRYYARAGYGGPWHGGQGFAFLGRGGRGRP